MQTDKKGLFYPHDMGKEISLDLQNYLKRFTTSREVVEVAQKNGISSSLLYKLKIGTTTLTEANKKSVEELFSLAIKNFNKQKIGSTHNFLSEIL